MSHQGHGSSSSSAASSAASVTAADNAPSASTSSATTGHGHGGGGHGGTTQHPEDVLYGILAILAVATLVNLYYLAWVSLRRYRARRAAKVGSESSTSSHAPLSNGRLSLRRIPHAVLSASRIVGSRLRIRFLELNMTEVVFTIAYLVACLVWVFAPVDGTSSSSNLTTKTWANKAGKMATAQLPFIVLLAMKNNVITWLSGVGHEKLNVIHRITSRVIFILAWLHGGAYFYNDGTTVFTRGGWYLAGVIGLFAQTITTLISGKWFRRQFYEVFYVSHVVLILTFLIGTHIHVAARGDAAYIWPVWAFWIFDRLARGGRYVFHNLLLRPQSSKALISLSGGADGLRISLKRRIRWSAGQHVFIAFPQLGLESHPFTIASVCEPDEKTKEAEMRFVVRALGGQTRLLMERAAKTGSCELTALVDGPYGRPEDLRPFSTVVFIAGGTGIAYTLPRMHQLFRDVQASDACATRVVFVWAIRTEAEYRWVAADLDKILALAPPHLSVCVDVYLTGEPRTGSSSAPPLPVLTKGGSLSSASASSCENEKHDGHSKETSSASACETPSSPNSITKPERAYFSSGTTTPTDCEGGVGAFPLSPMSDADGSVRLRFGRPDVYKLLEEEVTTSTGTVAVDTSGPDGLVDSIRSALCAPFAGPVAALKGTPTVMLCVEQFRM